VATWPATLPTETERDFTEKPPNLLARTEMDAGPARVRRRYSAGVTEFEVSYVFSPDQMTIWESFYQYDIADGALSFTYPHPRLWGNNITARLMEPPQYKHLGGGYFEVTLKVEKLPS
jgi:hypothetical protein